MILEKLWRKKIPDNPIQDLEILLSSFSEEKHSSILNGRHLTISDWTPIQYLLLEDPIKHLKCLHFFVERGVNLCGFSKKRLTFFHLFLVLFFYRSEFRDERHVEIFLDFFRYSFPQQSVFLLRSTQPFTLMDLLIICQKKKLFSYEYFPPGKSYQYSPLPHHLYDLLYISMMCYGCKFYSQNLESPIDQIHLNNCTFYMDKYPIFKEYLTHQFKLPPLLSSDEIQKRIKLLKCYKRQLSLVSDESAQPLSNTPIPGQMFINTEIIDNCHLRDSEFFEHMSDDIRLHKGYLPLLLSTKYHPYTRRKLNDTDIQIWLKEIHESQNFPISTLEENINHLPYFFFDCKITDKFFTIHAIFHFIDQFFSVHHPYHQISTLIHCPTADIKYIANRMLLETKLFSKFNMVRKNPTSLHLGKVFYQYCLGNDKYVITMYFLLEEIFQDIKSFYKLKEYLEDFEENYFFIFDEYCCRFGTSNPQFFQKFLQNLMILKDFNLQS